MSQISINALMIMTTVLFAACAAAADVKKVEVKNGERATLECKGDLVIQIDTSKFFTPESSMLTRLVTWSQKACVEKDQKAATVGRCNGQASCSFTPQSEDDSNGNKDCQWTPRKLSVNYVCLSPDQVTTPKPGHNRASLVSDLLD